MWLAITTIEWVSPSNETDQNTDRRRQWAKDQHSYQTHAGAPSNGERGSRGDQKRSEQHGKDERAWRRRFVVIIHR
jgi:hypothetical protein